MTATAETLPRVRRPLWTSAWMLLLALVVIGFGLVASRSAAPIEHGPLTGGPAAAQRAVDALLNPGPSAEALNELPADFTQVTGVTPSAMSARDGTVRAVHTDGGCSTPWGEDNSKWDYAVPCKAHDLGYDLLRYAEKQGQPLGQQVRAALDDRLSADMHAMCSINPMDSAKTCGMVASLYTAGLVVNSWHQRWGPPVGEPVGPMLAGVVVIGCLLVFRLRDWLRARRVRPAPQPWAARTVRTAGTAAETAAARPLTPWAMLGAASMVLLVLGESAIALANWAGAGHEWLWPLTWLAQLAPLFFFACGRANAAGWQAELDAGGGYRQYLAHRASRLLRPALIFVVVALVVPLALELLGIPAGTNATVMRIALHPLWLIGVYLLTMVAAPALLKLHRLAPRSTLAALLGLVVLAEFGAGWLDSSLPRHAGAFGLALLAQQLAFWQAGRGVRTGWLVTGTAAGAAGLVLLSVTGTGPPTLLGDPAAAPALSAATLPVLLLGAVQLGLTGLFARRLATLAGRPRLIVAVRLVVRAPMSLYLGFLAAMLLLVALVYLPGRLMDVLTWLTEPRPLVALALLAGPAALVFWWFERHAASPGPSLIGAQPAGRLGALLAHAGVVLGIGYATIGVFGFALTRFGGETGATMLGLQLDPIQNLVQLLLGVFLLHAVRIGNGAAPSTWVVTALACVPPLLSATSGPVPDQVALAVHGLTALFAVAAAVSAGLQTRAVAVNAG
ncbi:phospholipase A2 [Amycolatopsis nigrescens]|uniref:phospholipase A2 n=1 Tax=Amycolatopsis nigrescens TaxID=381445 RepID=UPI000370F4B2|nr:phospholipase A2 [Amycolatopsis nigrescens]